MKRAIAIIGALVLGGCATVANGPMQRVVVESEPSGATVRLNNCGLLATKRLTTPGIAWVSRRATQCELVFGIPAEEQRLKLARHVSRNMRLYGETASQLCGPDDHNCNSISDLMGTGILAAIIFLPSFAVDAASGSMFELKPNKAYIEFSRPPH